MDPDPRSGTAPGHSRRGRRAPAGPHHLAARSRVPRARHRLGAHRVRHRHPRRIPRPDPHERIRGHACQRRPPGRPRGDARTPRRGLGRCQSAHRHAHREVRRRPRPARPRRRLPDLRLPDLLRRRARRHAAHHLRGRPPPRRRRPEVRAARGRGVLRHAHLRAPHPGPVAASTLLGADVGLVVALGLLVAIPTWYVTSYLYGLWMGKRIELPVPDVLSGGPPGRGRREPAPGPHRHLPAAPAAGADLLRHRPQHRRLGGLGRQ